MVDAESANPLKGANVATKDDVERAGPNTAASWWRYLNEDVDTTQTTSQLALYCFMTGYMCVLTSTCHPTLLLTLYPKRCHLLLRNFRLVRFPNG